MKKGAKGKHVKKLQYKLNKILRSNLVIDGHFGASTTKAVVQFQSLYGLIADGHVGTRTQTLLNKVYQALFVKNSNLLHFGKRRFVVFVDAGHGGIDEDGKYMTPGKRAYHKNTIIHQDGHYYEGFENRLIAEAFIEACTNVGIMCIRTYHPHQDTPLSNRTEIIRSWLRRGYYGYLHSFHSNAISIRKNTSQILEATRGFMVFSTIGNNFSDQIASQHFQHVKDTVGSNNWTYRTQNRKDGDEDFEVNFQILRETDLKEFKYFGAILEEWGFHSSKTDSQFITATENRLKRVAAALKTAKWVKAQFQRRNISHFNKL